MIYLIINVPEELQMKLAYGIVTVIAVYALIWAGYNSLPFSDAGVAEPGQGGGLKTRFRRESGVRTPSPAPMILRSKRFGRGFQSLYADMGLS